MLYIFAILLQAFPHFSISRKRRLKIRWYFIRKFCFISSRTYKLRLFVNRTRRIRFAFKNFNSPAVRIILKAPSTRFPNRVHRSTVNLITKNYCHRADRANRASSRAPRSPVSSVSPICGWLTATFVFQKWPDRSLPELRAPSRLRSHYADFQHCETKERPVRASSLGFRAS